jgi:DNA polymerase
MLYTSALIAAIRQVKTCGMDKRQDSDLSDGFAAALEWWREAGVDCSFHDAPTSWIAPPAPAGESGKPDLPTEPDRAAPQTEPPVTDRSRWPQDLDAFAAWWLSEPWLDGGRTPERVPPRGAQGAQLMCIVPEPEAIDSEHLLSGPQGKLLDAILAAMGIAPAERYIASVLPRHTPMADWQALAERGMGEVLAHHIALARPQRIIAFGGNILPLFGNDLPNSDENLRRFNHEGVSIPLLAASDLAVLLARPRAKARLWRQWLDWTGIGKT